MAYITNEDGSRVLVGTEGADTLDSTIELTLPATLVGSGGNDTYIIDDEDDLIVEETGGGTDTVRSYVSYLLGAQTENLVLLDLFPGEGSDLDATGNDLANSLTGNSGDNLLDGGLGNDVMAGGAGNDRYFVDSTLDLLTEGLDAGHDEVFSSVTRILSVNFEDLFLTGFANINGTGNATDNFLVGNEGNNTLAGLGGFDEIFGGGGRDIVDGGAGDDDLFGDDADDTLIGGAGSDYLNGGFGSDTLIGGAGDDFFEIDDLDKPIVEAFDGGNDTVISHVENTTLAANVENLWLQAGVLRGTGNALNNYLQGNLTANILLGLGGNDTLDGREGADQMTGGLGNDTYVVDNSLDRVIELAGAAEGTADKVVTSIFYTLPDNVENLQLAGFDHISAFGNGLNNVMVGNSGSNFLLAFGGNDTLIGGAGADSLQGGAGNDTYYFDHFRDFALEFKDSGTDTVFTSVGYDFVGSFYIENMTLTGSDSIGITANDLNNVIVGNSGANFIDGRGGLDTMSGGLGDDTYLIGHFVAGTPALSDLVNEGLNAGVDTVISFAAYVLPANVEKLVLGNTAGNINGTGNTLDNTIEGNAGTNSIDGGAGSDIIKGYGGADTLIGGLGNDVLDGGTGADIMSGGTGDDIFHVDNNSDSIIELAAGGTDTVNSSVSFSFDSPAGANLENLTLVGFGNISGTGNALNNTLLGNDSENALSGGAGNDLIDGRAGADAMTGGAGNDSFVVDNLDDDVIEGLTGGTDTVRVSISRGNFDLDTLTDTLAALEDNVENLVMLGTDDLQAAGNDLNNIMTGNRGHNFLDGRGGADTMIGGRGDDIYVIDGATDVITELAGEGIDGVLVNYAAGTYILGATLEAMSLALTNVAMNATGNALDNFVEGNAQANTLDGGAGNDEILGLGGNDILLGGAGDDILDGEGGADAMSGGVGNDHYFVNDIGDTITELAAAGTDTVESSITFTFNNAAGANLENLVLTESGNINATGNALANQIFGNAGNNIVDGDAGNDTFYFDQVSFSGSNLNSSDSVVGGNGSDALFADIVDIFGGLGALVISGVEDITFNVGNFLAGGNLVDATGIVGADRITVSSRDPGAGLSLTGLAAGTEIRVSGFYADLDLSLATNTGTDAQQVTLNGFEGALTTTGIETVTLNSVDNANADWVFADMSASSGMTDLVLTGPSGVLFLTMPGTTATAQISMVNANLGVNIQNTGLTSLDVSLDNTGTTLSTLSAGLILNLDTTGNLGASFVDVSPSAAALVNVTGSQSLELALSQDLDASTMNGNLTANASGAPGGVSMKGGSGNDWFWGSDNADRLNGGDAGNDVLLGGGGDDTFVFDDPTPEDHVVFLPDFTSGSDSIELKSTVFTGLDLGALNAADFYQGDVNEITGQNIVFDNTTGDLWFDVDGVAGAAVRFANLWYDSELQNTDIFIVA